MKVKLDENLGLAAVRILTEAGHETSTVVQEGLQGAEDAEIIFKGREEQLCLVTLDLGFSDTLLFPLRMFCGIAVLRPRAKTTHQDVLACIQTLARSLRREPIAGQLWVAEAGRIRIHREEEGET